MSTIEQRITALETAHRGIMPKSNPNLSKLTAGELISFRAMALRYASLPIVNGRRDLSGLTDDELESIMTLQQKINGVSDGND